MPKILIASVTDVDNQPAVNEKSTWNEILPLYDLGQNPRTARSPQQNKAPSCTPPIQFDTTR